MKLRIATPSALAVDATDVRYVRAEDATGAFGIQPGHTEFLTTLVVSVVTWRDARGTERHAAVRGGVLRVQGGRQVEIATREALVAERLEDLGPAVLRRMREAAETEARARTRAAQLHAAVVRNLYRYVRGERGARPLSFGAQANQETMS
jgi:F-type H+-transporting ATPase subunit epsilon